MGEIVADSIHAAATHHVKRSGHGEINTNRVDGGTWHVRAGVPHPVARNAGWVFSLCRSADLPLTQCERDYTDGEKEKQAKRASNKMRFNEGVDLFLHE
jgi:hypothetical protein